jgi:hypothetical protein
MEILELMKMKIMVIGILLLTTCIAPITVLGQGLKPASESERTLLNKSEIIELMIQAGQMSNQQQEEKIDQLWASDTSKTPRSDFLYCAAIAYLDNYKAQACLGRAFENGSGIVSNLSDAYVWYAIALDHPVEDVNVKETIQARRDHVKQTLRSVYPAPSDYELEDLVKNQKEKIEEYAAEAGKAGR